MDIIHQIPPPQGWGIINNLYSSEQDESRRQESLEEKEKKERSWGKLSPL